MSQENLEIVRSVWAAFERFDFPAEAFAEHVEWHTAQDLPDRETCRGPAAVQRMLAEGWGTVLDPGYEAEEVINAGDYVVVRGGAGERRAPAGSRSTGMKRMSTARARAGSSRYASFEPPKKRCRPPGCPNEQSVARSLVSAGSPGGPVGASGRTGQPGQRSPRLGPFDTCPSRRHSSSGSGAPRSSADRRAGAGPCPLENERRRTLRRHGGRSGAGAE